MRANRCLAILAVALGLGACQEADPVTSPGANTRLEVLSDPENASILIDGVSTGKTTPATLFDLATGSYEVIVRIPGPGDRGYGYAAEVELKGDSLHRVNGPLLCGVACVGSAKRQDDLNNIRVVSLPNGPLFFDAQNGKGLIWPADGASGYAAIGTPMIAAVAGTRDTLAFGIYNENFMAGRPPAPSVTTTDGRTTMRQSFWIVPTELIRFSPTARAMRGIEVEEELIGTSAEPDVAFLRLTFRNITNLPSYRTIDPFLPSGGTTYTWVYIGFGLDAEVGTADDDAVTYDPALDMVYMYDFDFLESAFPLNTGAQPGLIGLRILDAPEGATVKALNAWPRGFDWSAGHVTERGGWYHFSGTRSRPEFAADDIAGQQIGYAPNHPNDYRMSVAAGPLTLPPGESVSITVAVILASPVPGTYQSGVEVPPGNPTLPAREIERIAKDLLEKAARLVAP